MTFLQQQIIVDIIYIYYHYIRLTCTHDTGILMGKIRSFADPETQKIYRQIPSKKLPVEIQSVALRKLIMIDHAETLNDLRVPPANHLEKLQGNRDGQYSVRINLKYRICFSCREDGFYDVEICDYH